MRYLKALAEIWQRSLSESRFSYIAEARAEEISQIALYELNMNLCGCGKVESISISRGLKFLMYQKRPEGSEDGIDSLV